MKRRRVRTVQTVVGGWRAFAAIPASRRRRAVADISARMSRPTDLEETA